MIEGPATPPGSLSKNYINDLFKLSPFVYCADYQIKDLVDFLIIDFKCREVSVKKVLSVNNIWIVRIIQ